MLLGLAALPIAATPLADSLINRLRHETTDTSIVRLYYKIAREIGNTTWLTSTSDRVIRYRTALEYADSGLTLAKNIGFRKGETDLHRTVGAMYFYLNEYELAISNYEKALEIATEIKDEYGKAALMYNIALVYQRQEKHVETLKYFYAVLPYWEKMGLKQILERSIYSIAEVYNIIGEYNLSVEFAQKSITLALELNDTIRAAGSYEVMARNYLLNGDTLSSIDAFEKSIELLRLKHDIMSEARMTFNYAQKVTSLPEDRRIEMMTFSRRCFEQHDPEHDHLSIIYQNISYLYQLNNNPDSALYYSDKSIKHALLSGNVNTLGEIYFEAASLVLKYEKIEQAENYFRTALRYNEQIQSARLYHDCYNGLAEIYKKKGNYKKVVEVKRKVIQIQDSLIARENRHRIELLQMQHEIEEQKSRQEAEWKTQAEEQQQILKRRFWQEIVILFTICFVSIFLAVFFRNRRRTQKNNSMLQEQYEEILQIQEELRQSNNELNIYKEHLEDLVRRKTAEQAEKDQQIRNISDNLPGFIFRKVTKSDGQDCILFVSNRVEQLMGISADTLIASKKTLIRMMGNETIVRKLEEKEKESVRTMTPFVFEHQLVRNHQPQWIYYYSLPQLEENGDIVWDGYVIDITEQKNVELSLEEAKEQAEESDRLKSVFLSNMSHEVRTPMNAILGFIGFIERGDLSSEKRDKYIRIIHENIDRLMHLIKNIIDISKLDVQQQMIYPAPFALNPLMEEIRRYWERHINQRNLYLDTQTMKNLDIILDNSRFIESDNLINDSERIGQVFDNLIENAIKYTEKGFIRIGYEPTDDPSELMFFVEDTGIGIPKNQQDVIFEYFRQANDTNVEMYHGGTGLGLSISKGLVQLMGGRIWIESFEDQGSTFYFTIKKEINK